MNQQPRNGHSVPARFRPIPVSGRSTARQLFEVSAPEPQQYHRGYYYTQGAEEPLLDYGTPFTNEYVQNLINIPPRILVTFFGSV